MVNQSVGGLCILLLEERERNNGRHVLVVVVSAGDGLKSSIVVVGEVQKRVVTGAIRFRSSVMQINKPMEIRSWK
jgi:hypothetical protein